MTDSDLLYRVDRHTAWITINREAQRNAISPAAISLFLEYLDRSEHDRDVRVVCITGAGTKAFCSGADLGLPMDADDETASVFRQYSNVLARISAFPKPTVARVNGSCLAGGTGFMLTCDIVIAANNARFGTPEVNVGLFPMMIGALIFRNVPRKKAMEMILIGQTLTADQALSMGMITRTVAPEDLDTETENILQTLCAKSPIGLAIGKTAFHAASQMPLEEALHFLSGRLMNVVSTKDAAEGITAFIEKRPPVFKGE
jgi:enoyl-CoA hydratase/carnithine racemase